MILSTMIIGISACYYLELQGAITIYRECNIVLNKVIHVLLCLNNLLDFF